MRFVAFGGQVYIYYAAEDDCSNINECPTSFSGPLAYRMCCRQVSIGVYESVTG